MVLIKLFAGQQWRQTENRLVDAGGKGEGGMKRESSVETYTLPFVK